MGALRIFLSRTDELAHYPEDRSYVAAAEEAVSLFGGATIDMSYMAARDQNSADHCRERLENSDVYVGIIGFRYGTVVTKNDSGCSFTEFEFDVATELELERLVFLLGNVNLPAQIFEEILKNPQDNQRQQKFRERLQHEAGVSWKWVTTPEDLTKKLLQSLNDYATRRNAASPIPGHRSDAKPGTSPLDMASAVQKKLQSVLHLLQGAARTMEQVEHSYAEPARIAEWKSIDDKIKKHNELAESVTGPAASFKFSLEEAAREAENARKSVGKLGENWPIEHVAELTSIIDTISDLQDVSEQLLEKVATARGELEKRTFYSPAYQNPREVLSQAYDLIDATNAITIRMNRALSRPHATPEAVRTPNVQPLVEQTPRDASVFPGLERQAAEVRPISADWQAAAGTGTPSAVKDSNSVPVPSDRIRGSDVVAVKVQGDSMEGAGIHGDDYVIVLLQPTAQDRDIVVVATWEPGDSEYGTAKVKRFRQRPGEDPFLESEYSDRNETMPIGSSDRIVGKVIGIFRSTP